MSSQILAAPTMNPLKEIKMSTMTPTFMRSQMLWIPLVQRKKKTGRKMEKLWAESWRKTTTKLPTIWTKSPNSKRRPRYCMHILDNFTLSKKSHDAYVYSVYFWILADFGWKGYHSFWKKILGQWILIVTALTKNLSGFKLNLSVISDFNRSLTDDWAQK